MANESCPERLLHTTKTHEHNEQKLHTCTKRAEPSALLSKPCSAAKGRIWLDVRQSRLLVVVVVLDGVVTPAAAVRSSTDIMASEVAGIPTFTEARQSKSETCTAL